MGGIKKAERNTYETDEYHLESSPIHEGQAHDTGQTSGGSDGLLHGIEFHPAHRTGTTRSQTCLVVIRAVGEIKEVVDEIGVDLHDKSKEETQYSRLNTSSP